MKIFKFGGASVKDADGVKNILCVLKHTGFKDTMWFLYGNICIRKVKAFSE